MLTKPSNQPTTPSWNEECAKAVGRKRTTILEIKPIFQVDDLEAIYCRRAMLSMVIRKLNKYYWKYFHISLNRSSSFPQVWLGGVVAYSPVVSSNWTPPKDGSPD